MLFLSHEMEYWSTRVLIDTQYSITPSLHYSITPRKVTPIESILSLVKRFNKSAVIEFLDETFVDEGFRIALLDLGIFLPNFIQARLNRFERGIGSLVVKCRREQIVRELQIADLSLLLRLNPKFFLHDLDAFFFIPFEISDSFNVTFHESKRSVPVIAQETPGTFQRILQVNYIHSRGVAHHAITFFLGQKKRWHSQYSRIGGSLVETHEHGRRRTERNDLHLIRAHIPLFEHEQEREMAG